MAPSEERITQIEDSDIICGRKGVALKHPGNIAYRKIVCLNKELYATCLKTEKLRVSKSIVTAMREAGGRFLERDDGRTSRSLDEMNEDGSPVVWKDIGDRRAIEKTSQALREGQPKLLRKLAQKQQLQQLQSSGFSLPPLPQPQAYPPSHSTAAAMSSSSLPSDYRYQRYNPYASQRVTPPPSSSSFSQLLSQLDTSDLVLLAFMQQRRR